MSNPKNKNECSRRDFLKGGSAATLMAMLGAVPLAAQPAPSSISAAPKGKDAPEDSLTAKAPAGIRAPAWTKDLVIYEIATKGFTSPSGPESGTFKSLQAKIPYLKNLGVSGIWLTGHSLSDSKHFYNIWTQYACVDPFRMDPSLGTADEFKELIGAFHRAGIHVLLDVISHGVMNNSPLIKEHPDWFKGGTWGMTDYDWKARNPALDRWWVEGWVDTATRYGVDGFRVDVSLFRPDLWLEIRRRCAAAGHPIVICPEPSELIAGTTDFSQSYLRVSRANNAAVSLTQAGTDMAGFILSAYGAPGPRLENQRVKGNFGSLQLSCHDGGWEGFPPDSNPYVAQGSRCVFGYAFIFAPAIPVFMSGEEFDCDFQPLPTLSPGLFGGKNPGKGRWLYGSMIVWPQVDQPRHRAMLKDVARMIAIRREYADVLAAEMISDAPRIAAVPIAGDGTSGLPKPYVRWNGEKAILIAGNPTGKALQVQANFSPAVCGWPPKTVTVTDIWPTPARSTETFAANSGGVVSIPLTLAPDHTPGGGVGVWTIELRGK